MEAIGELYKRRLKSKEWLNIEITHFVNPHKFYFKLTESDRLATKFVEPNQVAINVLENDINEFYESQGHTATQSEPFGVKDKVAVWCLPLGKYIRCAVLSWEGAPDSGSCILWALDYGYVLKSSKQHIRPLPERFQYHIDRILCGGVYGVKPVGCEPDGKTLEWNASACRTIIDAVKECYELQYQVCFVNKHGVSLGGLRFLGNMSEETVAASLLLKHGLASLAIMEEVEIKDWEFFKEGEKIWTNPYIQNNYKVNEISAAIDSSKAQEKTQQAQDVVSKSVPAKEVAPNQINAVPVEPKKQASSSYSGLVMVPAGCDQSQLKKYKNPNHWHCAPSLRGFSSPGDRKVLEDEPVPQKTLAKTEPASKSTPNSNDSSVSRRPHNGSVEDIKFESTTGDVKDIRKGGKSSKNKENRCDIPVKLSSPANLIAVLRKYEQEQFKEKGPAPPLRTRSLQSEAISPQKADHKPKGEEGPQLQGGNKELNFKLNQAQPKETFLSKVIDHSVLVHSNVIPEPVKKIERAPFAEKVFKGMLREKLDRVYRVQAYAWPHLSSLTNSLFVINASKTGRTLSYVPALLTYFHSMYEDPPVKENVFGPRAIVLVPSSEKGQTLRELMCSILDGIEKDIVSCYGSSDYLEAKIKLLDGCSLLIATPARMARVLEDNKRLRLIDNNRLNHIILDETDLMFSRCGDLYCSVLKALLGMCKRNKFKRLADTQLVVTSRMWDPTMMKLSNLAHNPMIVLGDFLEAAFYGRAELIFEFVSMDRKIDRVQGFLREHPPEKERLIVLCATDSEIVKLQTELRKQGFKCIAYTSESGPDQRFRLQRWKEDRSSPEFLICQDATFYELDIRDMQNLLHFSLAPTWTQFTKRFAATAMSYENYVQQTRASPSSSMSGHSKVISLVLLDECNTKALNRLVHFVSAHGQLENLPPSVLKLNEIERRKMEESEEFNRKKLCPYALEFGECDEPMCVLRHKFTRQDENIRIAEKLPTEGSLKVVISKVFSPTWFSARLLQHRPKNSTKWSEIRESNRALLFNIKLQLHYRKHQNLRRHWPLNVNDVCVYNLQRVRILAVPQLTHPNVMQTVKVDVYFIDIGEVAKQVSSNTLWVCEDSFKDFPAQAVELRLMGVRPSDNERTWDMVSTKEVDNKIRNLVDTNKEVFGEISFSMGSTIWLKELCVMENLPTLRTRIPQCYLTKMLIEKGYGVKAPPEAMSARRLAEECGLLEIENKKEEEKESKDLPLEEKKHLEDLDFPSEEPVEVLSNECDVPLKDKYEDLQELLACQVSRPSTMAMTKPHGVEEWGGLPLYERVPVQLCDKDRNGEWSNIYLRLTGDEHRQRYDSLACLLKSHMELLKTPGIVIDHTVSVVPMQNCIVKFSWATDDSNLPYKRAKLIRVVEDEDPDKCLYTFYLCDFGCFVTQKAKDLYDDFLYVTTTAIVEFTPYQSVHCTLAGLQLKELPEESKCQAGLYLYAYALKEFKNNQVGDGLALNSYKIVLYDSPIECRSAQDFRASCSMFNRELIKAGAAVEDPDTKHVLNLDLDLKHFVLLDDPTEEGDEANDDETDDMSMEALTNFMQKLFVSNGPGPTPQMVQPMKLFKEVCTMMKEEDQLQKQKRKQQRKLPTLPEPSKPEASEPEASKSELTNEPSSASLKQDNVQVSEEQVAAAAATGPTSATATARDPPPRLVAAGRAVRPQVIWYQDEFLIVLKIEVPDVKQHRLEIGPQHLAFKAELQNGDLRSVVINFLYAVDHKQAASEIRGINFVVHLLKRNFHIWERLTEQAVSYPWLHCDLDATKEVDEAMDRELVDAYEYERKKVARAFIPEDQTGDSDTSGDEGGLETYNEISNPEDIYDPTGEL